MITQEILREKLKYDENTGVFVWAKKCRGVVVGGVAGYRDFRGYIWIRINKRLYSAHRLAWLYMTGEDPEMQIDHINHNKTDNRISNLRLVSNRENHLNLPLYKTNTSGYPGVSWNKRDKKFDVHIHDGKSRRMIGRCFDLFEAVCLRKTHNIIHGYHRNHGMPAR